MSQPNRAEPIRAALVCALARITYRKLDHWTRREWIRPEPAEEGREGSGYYRTYSLAELAVAVRMAAFREAGLTTARAAHAARNGVNP